MEEKEVKYERLGLWDEGDDAEKLEDGTWAITDTRLVVGERGTWLTETDFLHFKVVEELSDGRFRLEVKEW
jgi:hypothetical protein